LPKDCFSQKREEQKPPLLRAGSDETGRGSSGSVGCHLLCKTSQMVRWQHFVAMGRGVSEYPALIWDCLEPRFGLPKGSPSEVEVVGLVRHWGTTSSCFRSGGLESEGNTSQHRIGIFCFVHMVLDSRGRLHEGEAAARWGGEVHTTHTHPGPPDASQQIPQ